MLRLVLADGPSIEMYIYPLAVPLFVVGAPLVLALLLGRLIVRGPYRTISYGVIAAGAIAGMTAGCGVCGDYGDSMRCMPGPTAFGAVGGAFLSWCFAKARQARGEGD